MNLHLYNGWIYLSKYVILSIFMNKEKPFKVVPNFWSIVFIWDYVCESE